MGNCCVSDASAAEEEAGEQEIFKWSIDNFSSLLEKDEGWTYSSVLKIKGLRWSLKLNPKDKKSGDVKDYVSLSLQLDETSVKHDTVVDASFRLFIYDQIYGKHSVHHVHHRFQQAASTSSGKSCMMPLRTLKSPTGFIVGDTCVCGVEFVGIATRKAKATSETLYVRNTRALNEAGSYTWEIEDIYALGNSAHSPEFEVGGHKWSICFRAEENHVALFLNLRNPNGLPESSAILVEFTISIKDQKDGHRLPRGTGRCEFSNDARYWGWVKFVSWEDLEDSANGYLVKDKCCIEAKVAIIGSSKTQK